MLGLLAVRNLFHDKIRFAVTIIGVVFSVVLLAVQLGLFVGFASTTSNVIDHSGADLWITRQGVPFIEVAAPFSETKLFRARAIPGVARAEKYVVHFSEWKLPNGDRQNCEIIAFDPDSDLGGPWNIVEGSRDDLRQPNTVMIDRFYAERLGATKIGTTVEIARARAKVVGFTEGIRTFTTTPPVFTSIRNTAGYTGIPRSMAQFILVNVQPGANVEAVRVALKKDLGGVEVWTRDGFAGQNRQYWMFGTGAGIAVLAGALLGLLVGVVVVAQTIYAATMDHLREFGTLKAIGATNWFVYSIILQQAVLSAVIGYAIALGISLFIAAKAGNTGANIILTPPTLAGLFVITVAMCMAAALISINKVTKLDPAIVFKG